MQSSVCALILISSALILSTVVVDYAITVCQNTLHTNTPQLENLRNFENGILNQTSSGTNQFDGSLANQTQTQP